jgi:anti-anti-sigma factor
MTTDAMWIQVDPEHTQAFRDEAIERLTRADGEVVLDFTSVKRIDTNGVRVLEELAGMADEKSVKLVLRAVNMDVYRVLKLLKLAQRFTVLT